MTRRQQMRADDGAALVMALVFMLVVALFVTAALSKSESTSTATASLRERGLIQYALDGGIEQGLEEVRDTTRAPGASGPTCPAPAAAAPIAGSGATINGRSVTVTCEALGGSAITSSSLTTNFALVLLSTAGNALETSGAVAAVPASPCANPAPSGGYFRVDASVYLAGGVSNPALTPPLVLCEGHAVQHTGAPCTESSVAALTNLRIATAGYVRSCTEQTPAQATPALSGVTPRPALDPDVSGCYVDVNAAGALRASPCAGISASGPGGPAVCRIYYPGRYGSAPVLDGDNYFTSGSYWFDDAGHLSVNGSQVVIGGRRVNSTDQGPDLASTACSGVSDASAALLAPVVATVPLATRIDAAGGVQWVFDGDSQLGVAGDLTLHARPYTSPNPPFTFVAGGHSPWTSGGGSTTGGGASCSSGFALCNSSGGSRMVVNGRVYAPTAPAQLFATSGTENVVTGGAVLHRLKLGGSVGGSIAVSGPGGSPSTPPPFRTVRITSTTTGTADTNTAVATISNFAPHTVSVKSWRTGQ